MLYFWGFVNPCWNLRIFHNVKKIPPANLPISFDVLGLVINTVMNSLLLYHTPSTVLVDSVIFFSETRVGNSKECFRCFEKPLVGFCWGSTRGLSIESKE